MNTWVMWMNRVVYVFWCSQVHISTGNLHRNALTRSKDMCVFSFEYWQAVLWNIWTNLYSRWSCFLFSQYLVHSLFHFSHSDAYIVVSVYSAYPWWLVKINHLPACFSVIWTPSFVKCLFKSLVPFSIYLPFSYYSVGVPDMDCMYMSCLLEELQIYSPTLWLASSISKQFLIMKKNSFFPLFMSWSW